MILADDHAAMNGHLFAIERGEPVTQRVVPMVPQSLITPQSDFAEYDEPEYEEDVEDGEEDLEDDVMTDDIQTREVRRDRPQAERSGERTEADGSQRRKRRRRRRGRGRGPEGEGAEAQTGEPSGERRFQAPSGEFAATVALDHIEDDGDEADDTDGVAGDEGAEASTPETAEERASNLRKRRRRGRRGGRRNRREDEAGPDGAAEFVGEGEFVVDVLSEDRDDGETMDAEAGVSGEAATFVDAEPQTPEFVLLDRDTLAAEVEVMRAEAEEAAKPAKKPRAPRKPRGAKAAPEAVAGDDTIAETAAKPASDAPTAMPLVPAPEVVEAVTVQPTMPIVDDVPVPVRPEIASTEPDPSLPKKAGWWSKKIFGS
jgi:ribonuclease E